MLSRSECAKPLYIVEIVGLRPEGGKYIFIKRNFQPQKDYQRTPITDIFMANKMAEW